MNQRFTAVCLAVYAGCALAGIVPGVVLAAKAGQLALAALALVAALFTATVLASGAAELW